MKLGLVLFQTARSPSVAKVAAHAETAGFESIWLTERSHIPIDSVYGTTVGQTPMMYKSLLEPLIALAAAAQVTKGWGWRRV